MAAGRLVSTGARFAGWVGVCKDNVAKWGTAGAVSVRVLAPGCEALNLSLSHKLALA